MLIQRLLNSQNVQMNGIIINIIINTHEIHKCPRGEIGRHKGLKSRGIEVKVSP
jgi:hypothetical protein